MPLIAHVGRRCVTNLRVVHDDYLLPGSPPPVVIGTDTKTGESVSIPYEVRDQGLALVGMQGTGKSTVLERLILADLEYGTPGMVIDPHGGLAQRVVELATPEQAERIILLEADASAPFGINLLSVREPVGKKDKPVDWAIDNLVATFKKLYGEEDQFQPRLERYLRPSAETLIPSKLTLLQVLDLFEDVSFRNDCLGRVPDPAKQEKLRRFWARYDKLRPVDQL